ncbi:MAG: GHKL domain-containing protein [Tissierellia bacterium]|nr:GHKL domain-containing protein [Tissierellia bacterium]
MPQLKLWILYEYVLCLVEVLLFYGFISTTLERHKRVKKGWYYLSGVLLSVFILILTEIKIYSMIRTILLYLILFFLAHILFKGNIKEKVFSVTMFYFFLILSDILMASILSAFIEKDIQNIIETQAWPRLLLSQISKLLLFIFLRMVKNNYKKDNVEIPRYYWYWILLVYSISGINLLVIFNISLILNELNLGIQHLTITISLGSLAIVIITYYIFIKLNSFYKERNNYRIVEIKNQMLKKEMEERERMYEGVKKLQHDFKNHIICIEKLLEKGQFQLANEYVKDLKEEVIETYTWIKTGNHAVDAILNLKKSEGAQKKIEMDMKINIPDNLTIKPLDLCTILGNALDNSIEANERLKSQDKRYIDLKINPYKDYLFIEILNPSSINPIGEDGKLKTTKKDKENHGFGMKSIEAVVEKYKGILHYEYNDGKFILNIMLPL